jgi:hypothetical protein
MDGLAAERPFGVAPPSAWSGGVPTPGTVSWKVRGKGGGSYGMLTDGT